MYDQGLYDVVLVAEHIAGVEAEIAGDEYAH